MTLFKNKHYTSSMSKGANTQINKHTAGPWFAHYSNGAGWSVQASFTSIDQYNMIVTSPCNIASMAWWQFDKEGIMNNAISEANARLMAASPEMLEALWAILPTIEHGSDKWKIVADAIKKATNN